MLKNFEPRLYQQTIFATCALYNTLVVLPTGMGKTAISLMLASQRLKQYPNSKILILAPTKPLLDQHYDTFEKSIDRIKMAVFSGNVEPEKRAELWNGAQIFFSTPQTIENDIISGKINLKDVSLICFDECHRATGNYSYVYLAKMYSKQSRYSRVLGLTASPGSELETINEVITNLFVEKIEIRTEEDPDVRPYVHEIEKEFVYVELPENMKQIHKFLKLSLKSKLEKIKSHGYLHTIQDLKKRDLLGLQATLQGNIAQGDKSVEIMKSISLAAEAVKVEYALELLETQGLTPLLLYMDDIYKKSITSKTKAVKNLANDINFRSAYIKTKEAMPDIDHPKIDKLKEILTDEFSKNKDLRLIIFTNFRDAGEKINEQIQKLAGVKCRTFVGQAAKKGVPGVTQKEQAEILNDFRNGIYNVLIMTSVGEEGLDIPQVDLVIFYEPIPSAIRTVQRRGRTGRSEKGRVIILLTKDTRDEGYRWAAYHKEKRMYRALEKLKNSMSAGRSEIQASKFNSLLNYETINASEFLGNEKEKGHNDKNKPPLKIYADSREKGSLLLKELSDMNFHIKLQRLNSGDFILSKEVGVEYKKVEDFVNSIIDGRLLSQIRELKNAFIKPLIVVEGEQDIFSVRNIHPNAIRGMLATIVVSYGIPILQTKNHKETASLFSIIAKREQDEEKGSYTPHAQKPLSIKDMQEYVVSSLPNVGINLAVDLLKKFKSVTNVINASHEELKSVENLGEKKAEKIRDILNREYQEL